MPPSEHNLREHFEFDVEPCQGSCMADCVSNSKAGRDWAVIGLTQCQLPPRELFWPTTTFERGGRMFSMKGMPSYPTSKTRRNGQRCCCFASAGCWEVWVSKAVL